MLPERTPRTRNDEVKEILWKYARRIEPAAASEIREEKLIELLNFFKDRHENTIRIFHLRIRNKWNHVKSY